MRPSAQHRLPETAGQLVSTPHNLFDDIRDAVDALESTLSDRDRLVIDVDAML